MQNIQKEDDVTCIPVLLAIDVKGRNQFFSLFNEEYSAYPDEKEVLLQEGIMYQVYKVDSVSVQTEIEEEKCEKDIQIVYLANIVNKYDRMNCCKKTLKYLLN